MVESFTATEEESRKTIHSEGSAAIFLLFGLAGEAGWFYEFLLIASNGEGRGRDATSETQDDAEEVRGAEDHRPKEDHGQEEDHRAEEDRGAEDHYAEEDHRSEKDHRAEDDVPQEVHRRKEGSGNAAAEGDGPVTRGQEGSGHEKEDDGPQEDRRSQDHGSQEDRRAEEDLGS
jgi:hypothetical protein